LRMAGAEQKKETNKKKSTHRARAIPFGLLIRNGVTHSPSHSLEAPIITR
jgi:hypothetical protein